MIKDFSAVCVIAMQGNIYDLQLLSSMCYRYTVSLQYVLEQYMNRYDQQFVPGMCYTYTWTDMIHV